MCFWEKLEEEVEAMPKNFSCLFALKTFLDHYIEFCRQRLSVMPHAPYLNGKS